MSFKIALIFVLSLSLSGCSWWGGDVQDTSTIKLDEGDVLGNSTTCIDELSSFFSNYFSGTTTDADIQRNFDCVIDTVDLIFDNANEKDKVKGFSSAEILQILTTVYPKKDKEFLSDNIEILFLVKRIFAGGLIDGFSRKDQASLKKSLPRVKAEFAASKKAIQLLFFGKKISFDERNEGFVTLQKSFANLDKIKSDFGGELTEPEGVKVVEQIFKKDSLKRFKSLAFAAKTIVYNDEPGNFLISQKDFFERLIRILEVQARIRALDFENGFLFGTGYYDLEHALLLASGSFLKWAKTDSNWHLHVQSFGKILSAGQDAGFWTDQFTDATLVSSSIQRMITQIFEKEKLDLGSMQRLDGIFKGWVSRQEAIISNYKFPWIVKNKKTSLGTESKSIVEEVKAFEFPRFASENNSPIVIKREAKSLLPAELYFDQSLKHLLMTTANEVFKAYSSVQPFTKGSPKRRLSLMLPDLTRIFADIRPLGLEFGFNDPHHCGSEKRVLVEADSLTLSGNGDNTVSVKEAVEWLATMMSVSSASNQIFSKIEEVCALPGMKTLGASFLDRECALEQLVNDDSILKDHFPDTSHYADMLKSETRRKDFEGKLGGIADWFDGVDYADGNHISFQKSMYGSLNSCSENKIFPFTKREFSTSFAVNIYVENFFHQFDKTGVTPWGRDAVDPLGSDFIIDGGELSNFLKDKATGLLDKLVPLYKNSHWSSRFFSDSRIKRTLKNLPESTVYSDRSRIFQLLKMFLGDGDTEGRHPYADQYCKDVSRTQFSSVVYRKEDRLMCLPDDLAFF